MVQKMNQGNFTKPEEQQKVIKSQLNPLPHGDEGIAIIRENSDCTIKEVAEALKPIVPALVQIPCTDEEINKKVESAISACAVVSLRARSYCPDQVKTRVMCRFSDDEKVIAMEKKLTELQTRMEELHKEVQAVATEGQKIAREQFEYCVSNYGLALNEHFYWINDNNKTIEQVSLDCATCKGSKLASSALKEAQEVLSLVKKEDATSPEMEEKC
jgi:vacuolar-type H+-ATPase subunit F/Vma7